MVSTLRKISTITLGFATTIFLARIEQGVKVFNRNNLIFIFGFSFLFISAITIIFSLVVDVDNKKKAIANYDLEVTNLKDEIKQLKAVNPQAFLTSIPTSINITITNASTTTTTTTIKPT